MRVAAVVLVCAALGGCVSASGSAGPGESSPPGRAEGRGFAALGNRLDDVAAGRLSVSGEAATRGALAGAKANVLGRSALSAAQAVASGNPLALASQAVGTGMMMGQLAAAEAQAEQAFAQARAERAAAHPVPDADRPAEAQALLSIAGGRAGASASWRNPGTGASGTVTIGPAHPSIVEMGCQSGTRTYVNGGTSRRGEFLICREADAWFDLS